MTIRDLRDIFKSDTKFYLITYVYTDDGEYDKTERFEIKNILYGSSAFADISIRFSDIKAAGENEVEIDTDLPLEIFRAWKKYSDNFYEKYGE